MCNANFNYYSYEFAIGFTNAKELKNQWNYFGRFGNGGEHNSRVEFMLHPNDEGNMQGLSYFISSYNFNERMRSNAQQNLLSIRAGNTKVHVSIWRQDQRVRVYLNDKKVWDVPNALDAGININTIYFRSNGTDNEVDTYFLDNVKIATENADAKNKIALKGNYSTSHILFDVNSDKIKPESYGVLKEIATIILENKTASFKIVGHTDSDGDATSNLQLSQKRALAVKQALTNLFGINATVLQTDGKGETQPLAKNDTPEGKAQNRRVEFIKL
jgi:outer membrane protein OmpA-like peptidoglycan-associated protein